MDRKECTQAEAFDQAKKELTGTLGIELQRCSFENMLERLESAIAAQGRLNCPRASHARRWFARHLLKMKGNGSYKVVSGWLSKTKKMSIADVKLVLTTLHALDHNPPVLSPTAPKARRKPLLSDETLGINRRIIDHIITILNSLDGLIVETDMEASEVLDGDRMHIASSLRRICRGLGISVIFPESSRDNLIPLTGDDLSDAGLETFAKRRGEKR